MRLRQDRIDRAMRLLTETFGSPKEQQRGFSSVDTAAMSAATLLAPHMFLKFRTAEMLVRQWYATSMDAEHGSMRGALPEAQHEALSALSSARLAAQVANADLNEMASACGQRDDEYPRKAIERRLSELTEALQKIRASVSKVTPAAPDTAYYQLGIIDATAAIALGEDPSKGWPTQRQSTGEEGATEK